jgi:hypothetical protein
MEGNIDPSGPIIFPVCDSGHFVAIHKLEDDKVMIVSLLSDKFIL